jgi:hypothetical protein
MVIEMVDKVGIVKCDDYQDVINFISKPYPNGNLPDVTYIDWTTNTVYVLVADYWDVL